MHGEDRELDPAVGHEEQGVPRHHEHPVATAAQEALPNYRTQHDTERTLYVGNLHPFVTDSILRDVFETCGGVEEVKIVRCKVTNLSAGYGFVQFTDAKHAERALGSLHGRLLYGQELRLNWTFSRQQEDTSNHVQIFVGDLANDVNHRVLFDAFSARCANCSYVVMLLIIIQGWCCGRVGGACIINTHALQCTGMHVSCGITTRGARKGMGLCRSAPRKMLLLLLKS